MTNYIKNISIFFFLIFILSCDDENEPQSSTLYSGRTNITSLNVDGTLQGFSFKEGGLINRDVNIEADFVLSTITKETGKPIGSMLVSNNKTQFAFLSEDIEITSDSVYFQSIRTVPDSINYWEDMASIKTGQIYFVKTSDNKYAKLHFLDVRHFEDRGDGFPFSAATFDWVYQANGTKNF